MVNLEDFDINEYFEAQIDKRCGDILEEKDKLEEAFRLLNDKHILLERENKKFKHDNEIDKRLVDIKSHINIDNIGTIFRLIGLKTNDITLEQGMDYDKIPKWFKLYWSYYQDRESILLYFDLFDIKYDAKIKNFVMPNELDKKYVKQWVNNASHNGFVNSEYLKHNGGFFYRALRQHDFKTHEMTERKKSGTYKDKYLPWQYMLINPNILDDKIFDDMCDRIDKSNKNKYSDSSYNFFAITDYQQLDDEKLKQMSLLLPNTKNRFYDIHKKFMSSNLNILKDCKWMEKHFLKEISTNHYSAYFYGNYSDEVQYDFLEGRSGSLDNNIDYIKKSTLSKESKLELINKALNKKLEDL